MKKCFLLLICAAGGLLFPSLCRAEMKGSVTPSFSTGIKSQTDAIEERDLSGNFWFYKYGLSGTLKPDNKLSLKAGYEKYFKDFSGVNISDVNTCAYKAGIDYILFDDKEKSLKTGLGFKLRNKRYKDSPSLSYDQYRAQADINCKFSENYSLDLSAGINDYEYIKNNSSDVTKTYIKFSPEARFFDKMLEISASYRMRWLDYKNNSKDKSENVYSGTAILNLDNPFMHKIKANAETGKENTQDTEDREDSLRYQHDKWDIATYYKFGKNFKTQLEYGQKQRDYISDNNNYKNWYIKNKSNFKILKNKYLDVDFSPEYEYKDTHFSKINSKSYVKNKIAAGMSFSKRENWSFDPEFIFTDYDYEAGSASNQKT
ncbi:MAG: hypothetical protein JW946_06130, partial [Candidatus Omnitrophica bacterium]|nr:hypothetical protein [Candidatus Omnitrophota bacterium]